VLVIGRVRPATQRSSSTGFDTPSSGDWGAGADAFTIMKLAGHSSVIVSQRYVHPTPESCELAFERLKALNARELERTEGKESLTKVPTVDCEERVSH
jgi:hypothetical protein